MITVETARVPKPKDPENGISVAESIVGDDESTIDFFGEREIHDFIPK